MPPLPPPSAPLFLILHHPTPPAALPIILLLFIPLKSFPSSIISPRMHPPYLSHLDSYNSFPLPIILFHHHPFPASIPLPPLLPHTPTFLQSPFPSIPLHLQPNSKQPSSPSPSPVMPILSLNLLPITIPPQPASSTSLFFHPIRRHPPASHYNHSLRSIHQAPANAVTHQPLFASKSCTCSVNECFFFLPATPR